MFLKYLGPILIHSQEEMEKFTVNNTPPVYTPKYKINSYPVVLIGEVSNPVDNTLEYVAVGVEFVRKSVEEIAKAGY